MKLKVLEALEKCARSLSIWLKNLKYLSKLNIFRVFDVVAIVGSDTIYSYFCTQSITFSYSQIKLPWQTLMSALERALRHREIE